MLLRHHKILCTVICLLSFIACAKKEIEPETYLIQEGFVGDFYVIYNVESGLEPEYEGGTRVFRVPTTGMIHTQLPDNVGIGYPGMIRFFYVSEDGARVEITDNYGSGVEDTAENRNDKRLYVMGGGFGEFGFTEETTSRGCKYNHQHFYVGTLADALERTGYFRLQDYYLKHGYPCS